MKTPYRHIVWDWNGTLLNDTWLCLDIFNGMLREAGLAPTTLERHREEFEFPAQNYYRRMGFDTSPEAYARAARAFIERYEARRLDCALQPHARETLEACARNGCALSVLSAYKEDTLLSIIAFHKLTAFFPHITGQTNINGAGKLDRAALHLKKISPTGERVLMVGDSPHDAEVARALGADCALVACGHFPEHRLAGLGARVFPDLAALANALL